MIRKRNFKRHNVTLVRQIAGDDLEYRLAHGIVTPPSSYKDTFDVYPESKGINSWVEFTTNDLNLTVDSGLTSNWHIMWNSAPHIILQNKGYVRFGKDSYNQYIGYYNTTSTLQPFASTPVELDWDEITSFQDAINSVENVLDLVIKPVI